MILNRREMGKIYAMIQTLQHNTQGENPDETFEAVGECIVHNLLEAYGTNISFEGIMSYLQLKQRTRADIFTPFLERIKKLE